MKKSSKVILIILACLFLFCGTPVGLFMYAVVNTARQAALLPPKPGKAEFDMANDQIRSYRGVDAFGNSKEAKQLAVEYTRLLTRATKESFSGGHDPTFDPTKDHLMTYCHMTPGNCVLLVHVPRLNQYKNDVREKLEDLAWALGQIVVSEHAPETKMMGIGMRGSLLYGPILIGPVDEEPEYRASGTPENFYPFFMRQSATMPAGRSVVPETRAVP